SEPDAAALNGSLVPGTRSLPLRLSPDQAAGLDPHQRVLGTDATPSFDQLAPGTLERVIDFLTHAVELLAHVENHLDAGKVDPKLAGQKQDRLEPLDRLLVVETRVAFTAMRADQAFALVDPECLRMDF